jgi:hypothetical protein
MIPRTVAVAAKCALVAFAESVPVIIKCTPWNRWVAEFSMPVGIGPPTIRDVVTSGFESIMEPTLAEALIRGRIRCRMI